MRLLDALAAGLDEAGLRYWARALTHASGKPHVTRSYRYPYALVAWHSEPVGVDIERVEPCEQAFAELIRTPAEQADPTPLTKPDAQLSSLWCSKEALAKALGDAVRYDPGRLDSPMRWPDLRSGPWHAAPLQTIPRHTAWLCWRITESEPAGATACPVSRPRAKAARSPQSCASARRP